MSSARILAGLEFQSTSSTSPLFHSDLMTVESIQQDAGIKYSCESEKIDLEIARYEEAVRKLKSRRNHLAPVSRLPPEVLENVFLFCSAFPTFSYAEKWSWVIVSHICRHWRAVALNCPRLWSRPDFSNTIWAREMIKRSKMAPLTIILSAAEWITPRMGDAIIDALQHVSRASEIQLVASKDNLERILKGVSSSAPYLQSLVLDVRRNAYSVVPREFHMLPPDFLAGGAAWLSKLELTQVCIGWDSPLLKNLTVLKFHLGPGSITSPTLTQFLNALEEMPHLSVLDLEHTLPTYNGETSDQRTVSLPRLTKLRAVSVNWDCALLLGHLTFPSSTSVHLSCRGKEVPDINLINIVCTRLSEVFVQDETRHIKNLSLQSICVSTGGIRLTAWSTLKKSSSQPWLYLEFTWSSSVAKFFSESANAACSRLPLSHLRELSIISGYNDGLSAQAILSLFGTLTKLNTISVQGNGVYELVEALTPTAAERIGTGMAFPSLRTLELNEVDFDREREERNMLLDPLMDCLMMRCEYRSELQKLSLLDCFHLFAYDVDQLKEIVVNVEWDAVELGYTDTESDDYTYDEDAFMSEDGHYHPTMMDLDPWDDEMYFF